MSNKQVIPNNPKKKISSHFEVFLKIPAIVIEQKGKILTGNLQHFHAAQFFFKIMFTS